MTPTLMKSLNVAVLVLGVLVELVLTLFATTSYNGLQVERAALASEQARYRDLQMDIEALRLQGQFRGACTAALLSDAPAQELESLCQSTRRDLNGLYFDNPPGERFRERSASWQTASRPDTSAVALFQAMTTFNQAIVDQAAATTLQYLASQPHGIQQYGLISLYGEVVPQLTEQLGVIRGEFSLAVTGRVPISGYLETLGAVRPLLLRLGELLEALRTEQAVELERLTRLGQQLLPTTAEYVSRQSDAIASGAADETTQALAGRFAVGTAVIDRLLGFLDETQVVLLDSTTRQEADLDKRTATLAVTIVIAQFVLLVLGVAIVTSLRRQASTVGKLQHRAQRDTDRLISAAFELRTPAATLYQLSRELDESVGSRIDLLNNSAHLLRVIDDIHDTSMDEGEDRHRSEVSTFSLEDLAAGTGREMRALLLKQGIDFSTQAHDREDVRYQGNLSVLLGILTGLVRQAALMSGGTHVWLTLDAKAFSDSQDEVSFCIEDDGRFDLTRTLLQGNNGDARDAPERTRLHNIDVWLSDLGSALQCDQSSMGGTRYITRIRLRRTLTSDSRDPSFEAQTLAQEWLTDKTVLLIDDDALHRRATRDLLQRQFPVSVLVAGDGREGLHLARAHAPDLIITDYYMSGMSGTELIAQLHAEAIAAPVVALTAATGGDERQKLWDAGAAAVLPKPMTPATFIETVVRLARIGTTGAH